MNYENKFHLLLGKVSEDAGWVLQLVRDTGGGHLAQLRAELAYAGVFRVEASLRELETLGLVACVDGLWNATWLGAGVSSWRTQLLCADEGQTVDEPREGENGQQPGPECSDYRAALFAPGYCWCRRPQKEHASKSARAARRLIRR